MEYVLIGAGREDDAIDGTRACRDALVATDGTPVERPPLAHF